MINPDDVVPAVAAPDQIRWMVTNLTKYRNDSKVRCQFFSNFTDASYAFYITVDYAIERVKADFRGCNYDNAEKLRDEFFASAVDEAEKSVEDIVFGIVSWRVFMEE